MTDKFNGLIEKVYVKFNDKAKRNSISIINNGGFYGLGLHNEKFVKVGDVVLKEGMQVEFEYSGQFNTIDMNTFKIIKQEIPKEVKKQQVDKTLPIRLGNALTVAQNFTKTYIDVVAIASKQVLPEVDKLRDKLAKQYTQLDDYALGARVGQCVVIASQFTKDINSYIEVAEQLFHEMCRSEEELKNVNSNIQDKNENKVKNEKIVSKVKETKPEPVVNDTDNSEPELDWDSDIPF
jgi:membrane-associated HD superfamily phosphohydrolase